jgi:hypothetical protein
MKNPHFEKPQAGNPYGLTVWQHIIPKKSIARFTDARNFVSVSRFKEHDVLLLKPDNTIFCAKRVWNQRAEDTSIYTENAFQKIADQIVSGQLKSISSDMQIAVTNMYLLWRVRYLRTKDPIKDQSFATQLTGNNLSKDQQEILEKNGYFYVRHDGTMPSRAIVGVLMQRDIMIALNYGANKMKWGLIKVPDGLEFLCGDVSVNQPLLPVSPEWCLVAGWPDGTATPFSVGVINNSLITESENYWFARNPEKCAIINRTNTHFLAPRLALLNGGVLAETT